MLGRLSRGITHLEMQGCCPTPANCFCCSCRAHHHIIQLSSSLHCCQSCTILPTPRVHPPRLDHSSNLPLLDISLQEAPVKVAPDGVVDEPLLLLGLAPCLVLEHHVFVPPPLDCKGRLACCSTQQRVALHELLLLLLVLPAAAGHSSPISVCGSGSVCVIVDHQRPWSVCMGSQLSCIAGLRCWISALTSTDTHAIRRPAQPRIEWQHFCPG
jgi:hypothetical protein